MHVFVHAEERAKSHCNCIGLKGTLGFYEGTLKQRYSFKTELWILILSCIVL